jgi:hypothetical protein
MRRRMNSVAGSARLGSVNVEKAVVYVIGMECQTEETTFRSVVIDTVANVQERCGEHLTVLDYEDDPGLFYDEEAVVASVGDVQWFLEAIRYQ